MLSEALRGLHPMTNGVTPIGRDEREVRIEKARRLMVKQGIDAILLEGGSNLDYFTGVRWGQSERLTAAVLPVGGDLAYVCPAFEEARLREMILFGSDVYTWEEHESPFACVARILADRGIAQGRIGMEESVRYFVSEGIGNFSPLVRQVSAAPITIPCRGIKSVREIALMQRAMDIMIEALKVCVAALHEGMSQREFLDLSVAACKALGVSGHVGAQFGETTAYPHGSRQMTYLHEGDVVLMDGGCTVEGYWADISRTVVFGKPTLRQREMWELEKAAQAAAFDAAGLGTAMEAVDAAARQVLVDAGLGPGYKVPGLPHRVGHGIGLDIHEPYYVVKGNKIPLATGMCFSNEPMIAIYGEFGIRLEDCVIMTDEGPRYFTEPSPAIDQPFAS
jgi:Xaa-Pro dipeptidase